MAESYLFLFVRLVVGYFYKVFFAASHDYYESIKLCRILYASYASNLINIVPVKSIGKIVFNARKI